MDKLNPETDAATPDIINENIEKLRELFPDAFTEGSDEDGPRWKVDFEAIQEILGEYREDQSERYSFNWNGKAKARRIAQTPSTGTLRPCPEESVNWDSTENLFIEGDNLEVLKLMQKSYHKKIKMIYIDPPYNTGNDFIYPDNFRDNIKNYMELTGQTDEEGRKLSANAETSGRYHTDWLNMMYPRLKLARNLLRDDGVIFISIDDNEVANLRKLCDEIIGEENFLANVIWEKVHTRKNSSKYFSTSHDHIIVYAKVKEKWDRHLLPREDTSAYKNPDNDPKGLWKPDPITAHNYYSADYVVKKPNGIELHRPEGRYWAFSKENWLKKVNDNEVLWGNDDSYPMIKRYLSEVQDGLVPITIFGRKFAGDSSVAKKELESLIGIGGVFDYPKPSLLIQRCIQISMGPNEIALDFFAGSATAAHAVFNLNKEDQEKRKFIMVQLPELTDEKSEAFKAGYSTIAEIGKERIRRVIKKIGEEQSEKEKNVDENLFDSSEETSKLDLGFKVFKLDSSNIKPWDADFDNLQSALLDTVENIKLDRSEADVLYELLLKYGLDLTVPIEEHTIADRAVYVIGSGALIVCLSEDITLHVVEGIASLNAGFQTDFVRVVFKDSGFADDVVKTNAMQILVQAGIEDVKSL